MRFVSQSPVVIENSPQEGSYIDTSPPAFPYIARGPNDTPLPAVSKPGDILPPANGIGAPDRNDEFTGVQVSPLRYPTGILQAHVKPAAIPIGQIESPRLRPEPAYAPPPMWTAPPQTFSSPISSSLIPWLIAAAAIATAIIVIYMVVKKGRNRKFSAPDTDDGVDIDKIKKLKKTGSGSGTKNMTFQHAQNVYVL